MAAIATGVSLAEYLRTAYDPDVEYVHGELREKPMPTLLHGIVQMILGTWFFSHRKEWGIVVAAETRTQVDKDRVRLPDLVLLRRGEGAADTLVKPPLIAVEILSPSDRYSDLRERASELRTMGTENIWLLDPELQTAEVWSGKNWQSIEGSILQASNSPVFLDLEWLWAEVNSERDAS